MSVIFKYFKSEIKIMSAVKRELVPIIIVKEIIDQKGNLKGYFLSTK